MNEAPVILVTGGAGFIGGNFVLDAVGQRGATVVNLDKLTYAGHLETLEPLRMDARHHFVHGDIADGGLVADLLERFHPRWIVNFAAETHVDRSIDGPADFIQTNVVGTLRLLEAARAYHHRLPEHERGKFRLLHVSTDEVYGSLGAEGKFREDTPYAPNSPYSASKAAADHLVRAYHHTYGLPVLTTNCSNNYGPYQFPEKLIPRMILNALEGRPLPVYGQGANVRDWLHVLDHCAALWRVLEDGRPGEVYNVGGDSERTNLQVVETLCALLDERLPDSPHAPHTRLVTFVTDRPGHDLRYAIDATKLKRELGWTPAHDFTTGLAETVDWYLAHRDWCRRVQEGQYGGERLGLGDRG